MGDESLGERLARAEVWITLHPETHRLEKTALDLAYELQDREHQSLVMQVQELKDSRNVGKGERGAIEKFVNNPLVLLALGFLLRHLMLVWK